MENPSLRVIHVIHAIPANDEPGIVPGYRIIPGLAGLRYFRKTALFTSQGDSALLNRP